MTIAFIDRIDEEIALLKKHREESLNKIQSECNHPYDSLVEGNYKESYFGTQKPFRVCKKCGYWKLESYKNPIPSIDREFAQKYVKKFLTQEQMGNLRYNK